MAETTKGKKDSLIVGTAAMADVLCISSRRVQQLDADGIIAKVSRGKYSLVETTQKYIRYLQDQAYGSKLDSESEEAHTGTKADEEIGLKRARRLQLEAKNKVIFGELHEASVIKEVLNSMIMTFKGKLLNMPSKLAPLLVSTRDANEVKDILDEELRQALQELSEYDPSMFSEGDFVNGDTEED